MYKKEMGDMNLKMNYKQAVLVSLPFFAITMFWQAYDTIMPQILTYHFGVSKTVMGAVMGLDNLIALLFLPLFGTISDRMNCKYGRRTPFVFFGTLVGALSLMFLSWADNMQVRQLAKSGIAEQYYSAAGSEAQAKVLAEISKITSLNYQNLILLGIALLVGVFAMSVFRAPAVALISDTFIRPQRSKGNAILDIMGGAAGILFLIFNKKLATLFGGYGPLMVLSSVAMVFAILIYIGSVRENKLVAQMQETSRRLGLSDESTVGTGTKLSRDKKVSFVFIMAVVILMYMGYNGYTSHFSVYAIDYLKMTSSSLSIPLLLRVLAVLAFSVPAAILSTRIGRKMCVKIGLFIAGGALFGTYFLTADTAKWLSLFFIVFAAGFALVSVNIGPMLLELCKDGDTGKYTGYYYVGTALAQTITPAIAGGIAQILTYKILPIYGTVFMFLGFIVTYLIRHGDSKKIATEDSAIISEDGKEQECA